MLNPDGEDPKLMYLDPHFVQDAISAHRSIQWMRMLFSADSHTGEHWLDSESIKRNYHCGEIRTMSLSRICPSLAIGFYLKNMDDFGRFKTQIEELRATSGDNCIFSVFKMQEDSQQYQMEEKLQNAIEDNSELHQMCIDDDIPDFDGFNIVTQETPVKR